MEMEKKYLNEKEVSKLLGIPRGSLANDRWLKKGLPHVRIGGRIRYAISDINKYIEDNRIIPEQREAD